MIGSLLPSVFPRGSFGVQNSSGDDTPAVRDVISTPLGRQGPEDSDEGGRGLRLGQHDFVHAAKNMIGDALKTFTHDLRDTFKQIGFQGDMVMRLAHDVMDAAKQALKSGADFSANLMMAAVSQTTYSGAAGSMSSFELVASEIEITINHTAGTVSVNATQVEIQGQIGDGAAMPRLVDFTDTGAAAAAPLLAMSDLDAFLANDGDEGEAAAMDPVLASLPDPAPAAASETDPAPPTDAAATEASVVDPGATTEVGDIVPVLEATGVSHIIITAFERYLNSDRQQITFIKLDAIIPLTRTTAPESVAEAMAKEVTPDVVAPPEVPIVEQVIEQPVGQIATTDLVV